MPTYEYECQNCDHRFDILQRITADRLTTCPECKQDTLKRLIGGGSGIIFKGSGFYSTDNRTGGAGSSGSSSSSDSSKSDSSSSDSSKGKSDSKSKSEAKT